MFFKPKFLGTLPQGFLEIPYAEIEKEMELYSHGLEEQKTNPHKNIELRLAQKRNDLLLMIEEAIGDIEFLKSKEIPTGKETDAVEKAEDKLREWTLQLEADSAEYQQ
ncbi:MAG: hypothetical protein ACOX3W_00490 [Christensenellaceae bacterium]|jgi:hypothetical protein